MSFNDILQQIDSLIVILSSEEDVSFTDLEFVYDILNKFSYESLTDAEATILVDKISIVSSLIEDKKLQILSKLENKNKEIELLKDIKKYIQELISK
ncbi:MAG: hypothetical protein WHT47_08035, partial [Hydrogenothermaceae bacterium]